MKHKIYYTLMFLIATTLVVLAVRYEHRFNNEKIIRDAVKDYHASREYERHEYEAILYKIMAVERGFTIGLRKRGVWHKDSDRLTVAEMETVALALYAAQKTHGIKYEAFLALITVESGWNKNLIGVTGDVGLTQQHPHFFYWYKSIMRVKRKARIRDVKDNILAGIFEILWCREYGENTELRLEDIIAAYNAGAPRVFSGYIPESTKAYIRRWRYYYSAYVENEFDAYANF